MEAGTVSENGEGSEMDEVAMLLSDDGDAFDQPCAYGFLVKGHAVYCCNDEWKEGPRKCRRTWYTGGEVRDEDCPGFKKNEEPSHA